MVFKEIDLLIKKEFNIENNEDLEIKKQELFYDIYDENEYPTDNFVKNSMDIFKIFKRKNIPYLEYCDVTDELYYIVILDDDSKSRLIKIYKKEFFENKFHIIKLKEKEFKDYLKLFWVIDNSKNILFEYLTNNKLKEFLLKYFSFMVVYSCFCNKSNIFICNIFKEKNNVNLEYYKFWLKSISFKKLDDRIPNYLANYFVKDEENDDDENRKLIVVIIERYQLFFNFLKRLLDNFKLD